MSTQRPLATALRRIADGAGDAEILRQRSGAGLALDRVHAAARRRRARFTAGLVAAAAAVAAVLFVGAAAVDGLSADPVPPADTEWDVDYSLCGGPPPEHATSAGEFALMPRVVDADSSALLTVETGIFSFAEGSSARPERVGSWQEIVALDEDHTVVGVLGSPAGGAAHELLPYTDDTAFLLTTAPLFSCAQPDGATRLGPGRYNLRIIRDVERLLNGEPRRERLGAGPHVTIPEGPAGVDDLDTLPAVPIVGNVPACHEELAAPDGTDPVIHVALHPSGGATGFDDVTGLDEFPPVETFDEVTRPVQASATLIGDPPSADPLGIVQDGVGLLLTSDSVVVGHGYSVLHTGATQLEPGTTTVVGDLLVSPDCRGGPANDPSLPLGEYELWVLVELEDGVRLLAGPWPLRVTGTVWQVVDASAVPVDLPVNGDVLRVEAHVDGDAWRVTTDMHASGREAYAAARDALVADGFVLEYEQSDPDRPMWSYAAFSGEDSLVDLDVSNETGGGFYGTYLIRLQWTDGP